jgi:phosphatidylglycerol lysyltransferase
VGVTGAAVVFAAAHLLRPARPHLEYPDRPTLDRLAPLVASSRDTNANLAFLGDKRLLLSDSGRSFLMYAVEGRSWVAMGDPIGPEDEAAELAWSFRELSDRYGGWTVFYEVGPKYLPLYIDLGLTLLKLGEEGRVDLAGFGLEGGHGKGFRRVLHQLDKDGCEFAIVGPDQVPALLPELQPVSDAWLAHKRNREKGFSLGFFDPSYLARLPMALVRRSGRVLAFANLWLGADREELSVDLLRYGPDAPPSVSEYLALKLMLWGREQGYRWYNLGMAPMSGLQAGYAHSPEDHALAPLWNRFGAFLYSHGGQFYNFQGLRQYKDKFDPVWQPRYLACPGSFAVPRVLANVASLVSGGMRGVVAK